MANENTCKSFNIGDLVFAKVNGYIPWPAVVSNEVNSKKQYTVLFYGTRETGYRQIQDLLPYAENKEKYSTKEYMKRAGFRKAMIEINKVAEEKANGPKHVDEETEQQLKTTAAVTSFQEPSRPANNEENNMVLVYLSYGKVFGININHNKPDSFENAAAEQSWINESRKEAKVQKEQMLSGQLDPKSLPGRIIVEPSPNETGRKEERKLMKDILKLENALTIERDFSDLCAKIRQCLPLRQAHVTKCLKNLGRLKKLELTKVMLLRHPESVDTLRKLQGYVGNLKKWKMPRSDKIKFEAQAKIIRQEATIIYARFPKLFDSAETKDFWQEYCKEVKIFKETTKKVNSSLRVALDERMYNNLIKAGQENTPAPAETQ
ncbi:hepatoma-derived growth factor-like [Drosophila persimilis]|uniref:hepatoma-derived growth factor-like n=2 Tax=Drosophila persimilis TaxID=7234 RepID=UPI000F07C69B|nr:hepatoma-derived growth factor-like [Drosophila persimilis]